jgi:Family of unknown function (DUF6445)
MISNTFSDTPTPWLDAQGRFFNPQPRISLQGTGNGGVCVVVDEALANPQGLREWAAQQAYSPPAGYPYPGHVCELPADMSARVCDHFIQHVRSHLGVRRALGIALRLSVIDTPPQELAPLQWMCHRDRLVEQGSDILFAASVLYLFEDATLGGTSFYAPRHSVAATEALVADSQSLNAHEFGARYGLQAGYMAGSNAYFERTAQLPAAWNRLIFYDGSLFHSADVDPTRLHKHPLQGRLTLNSFITCRRSSR